MRIKQTAKKINNVTGPVTVEGTRVVDETGEEVAQVGIVFGTVKSKKPKKSKG